MEEKPKEQPNILNNRFQNLLQSLSKCKIDIVSEKEEIQKMRELNTRLESDLKEIRELEKSHRYHLQTSREMIGNLQETVSQLVYLKRDVKKLKEELCSKDSTIAAIEKEKEALIQKHTEIVSELRRDHENEIKAIAAANERQIQQVQHDSDTQIAQFTCVIEELRSKIQEMETEHRDKMNVVVLDYEEKIQRSAAQVSQLQEQLARQAVRTDSNIDAYRKRLEELEEKLKQSQFKQYLAQSSYSQYNENVGERPYSVERDFPEHSFDTGPVLEPQKQRIVQTPVGQNKAPKQSTLQVMYYGNKTPNLQKNDKKGQFTISKKRKLYSEKDLADL